jgi:hypothetical protein
MSKPKRLLGLGLLTSALAALAFAAPAQATNVLAYCVYTGTAKIQDKTDPTIGVRLVGGKGTFVLNTTTMACVGVAKGAPEAQLINVTASGWYNNVVCGTGKAVGTITSVTGPAKYQALLTGKKFAIEFVGSYGVFYWHTWASAGEPNTKTELLTPPGSKSTSPKNWQQAGDVFLQPPSPLNKSGVPNVVAGECTKALTVTGDVVISE